MAYRDRVTPIVSNILNMLWNPLKKKEQEETERVISVITLRRRDSELVISIIENGKGIDPGIMPRLFSKLQGLGLFIAKSIVEAHGGKIWAENNSDGKGDTFLFSIPLSS